MGPDVLTLPWSTGPSNGGITTINANLYTNDGENGASMEVFLLGVAESWHLADHICQLHNDALSRGEYDG
jgi:hypothetical protein